VIAPDRRNRARLLTQIALGGALVDPLVAQLLPLLGGRVALGADRIDVWTPAAGRHVRTDEAVVARGIVGRWTDITVVARSIRGLWADETGWRSSARLARRLSGAARLAGWPSVAASLLALGARLLTFLRGGGSGKGRRRRRACQEKRNKKVTHDSDLSSS
jgi:hypothetical protein